MLVKPCDRLGDNLHEAGLQWGCELDAKVSQCLIEDIQSKLGRGNFEDKLEFALDLEEVFDATKRHAYKMALGTFFYTRRKYIEENLSIPFAPR